MTTVSFLCRINNEWFNADKDDYAWNGSKPKETRNATGEMIPMEGYCPLCEKEHTVYRYERR